MKGEIMKLIPYKKYHVRAVGVKHETNLGGIAIYETIGAGQGELTAVRFRHEYGGAMSYMRKAKIRWAIPKRAASDGNRPVEPIPYFKTDGERIYLDEVEMCSPGWGPMWGAEYEK
jgi:hypothetical protein